MRRVHWRLKCFRYLAVELDPSVTRPLLPRRNGKRLWWVLGDWVYVAKLERS